MVVVGKEILIFNNMLKKGDGFMYKKVYADYNSKQVMAFDIDSSYGSGYYEKIREVTEGNKSLSQVIFSDSIMVSLLKYYLIGLKYEVTDLLIESNGKKEDYSNMLKAMSRDRAYIALLLEKIEKQVCQSNGLILEVEVSNGNKQLIFKVNGVIECNENSLEDSNFALLVVEDYLFYGR